LFTLYQGLTGLQDLATAAHASGVTQSQLTQYQTAFAKGLRQLQTYLGDQPFRGFQVAMGGVAAQEQTGAGVTAPNYTYTTGVLADSNNTPVQAFAGNVQFAMTVTLPSGSQKVVNFNLADMGSTPRSLSNVVSYLNSQLQAAGVATTFSDVMKPGQAQTTTVGNQTYTTPAGPDTYTLQINGNSVEQISLSAPQSSAGVYVTQSQGSSLVAAADVTQQLLGLNTVSSASGTQTFSDTLGKEVQNAVAAATAPDGSVYVLADVNGATQAGETDASQSIAGTQDVALMKYDSAGNLIFTRTLGSTASASGLGLAVSASGNNVAVVGAGSGLISTSGSGASTTNSSGFLALYDGEGQIKWTQSLQNGQAGKAGQVTFGAGGSVYVAGTTQLGGAGLSEGYRAGYTNSGVQLFSTSTGLESQNPVTGIAVDGASIVTAGIQNGDAVVQSYALGAGTATLSAARDLGALDGGNVVGVGVNADGSVVVGGSTHNGALNVGAITNPYAGGEEVFVAQLSGNLTPSTSDALTYYGTGGDTRATAMTVVGGQAYLAGQAASGSGVQGFAAQIDPTSGAVGWSNQYSGVDNTVDPTSIAVNTSGYSSLNALGLPTGAIHFAPSQTIAANAPVQPGEQFLIQTSAQGVPSTVTIDAGDTLQSLAQKIIRASGFEADATVATTNGVQHLQITPAFPGVQIRIMAGPSGANALPALGLSEGVLATNATAKAKSTTGGAPATNSLKANYALGLASTLHVNNSTGVKNALVQLGAAITQVKQIYTDMTTAPHLSKGNAGSVPAYLSSEIASYQSALYRLTASNNGSSSSA
ncbi:MAG TPA: hypothetical protein VJP88_00920, partial [Caulobacteraceae bacterium]|nr:hypothetical protein [Caulobacteraceae bacterium]